MDDRPVVEVDFNDRGVGGVVIGSIPPEQFRQLSVGDAVYLRDSIDDLQCEAVVFSKNHVTLSACFKADWMSFEEIESE